MNIVVITTVIASLFLVIGLAEPLAARMRLPYVVMLALLGILIGTGSTFFLHTELTDALNPVAAAIVDLPIRANVFMYVFLPTLLFQATLGMDLRRMLDDWVPILALAVIAVLVAALAVGYALFWTGVLPLAACLLIGAIVSTTDPSGVIGIFRSISAPQRLSRIIEGESLLNDAAAIALFGIFMGVVMQGVPDPSLQSALAGFPQLIAGGALIGWLIARIAIMLMAVTGRFELAQLSISVAVPYLAYIGAEQSIGASGIIAVVTAGMTLNFVGPTRLSPQTWQHLREVWDLLSHWAGALIFILAALLIPRLLQQVHLSDMVLVLVMVAAAMTARALILFALMPLLSTLRLSPPVEQPYRIAILWGGLRGAVTLALALAVTESVLVPDEVKRMVGILATGFTLFTLIVQGSTLRLVISYLGLDKLSSVDQALSNQVLAVTLQTVREDVEKATDKYNLTHETVRSEAKLFGQRLDRAVKTIEDNARIPEQGRLTLALVALAGAERDSILARLRERVITSRLSEQALTNADRIIEATRTDGKAGYLRAAEVSLSFGHSFKNSAVLYDCLGISKPLASLTSDRFELLLTHQLILRDLHTFIDHRIRRIHARQVADILHELLRQRQAILDRALDDLRWQYPGYAEQLERRLIQRITLRMEEREYDHMRADGLIGTELHSALIREIRQRHVARRPRLKLPKNKVELLRHFPRFAELDDATLDKLSQAVVTRHVNAGTIIIKKTQPIKNVYCVISGAVDMKSDNRKTHRLLHGEMFGPINRSHENLHKTEAIAATASTLLVVTEDRFNGLLNLDLV
ncbi:cation:proton antiporter [Granulosicoccus antarcticus]|uniref:Na(+)/H(+) antiporter NhaG n=1 Tax=Granulosicoccus antarcticus IMCC3135 TaxID=1192854 RepID=A0A2Z2NIG2_9GAMM|nr:cation:proton antiporter [Granulosicoccus antarcticus]ASJ70843.1 Na(+)/H(+) antiporter NhaG [Granulosicoccus antarcticus IMCC3135]